MDKGIYNLITTKKLVLHSGWTDFTFVIDSKTKKVSGHEVFGYTDFDKAEIHLVQGSYDGEIPESVKRLTVLHEIFHVIADISGFSAEEEIKGALPPVSNEVYVERTSKGLMLMQKLNPELFKYIFSYE